MPFLSLLIPHVAQLEVPKEMKMGLRKGWIARGQRRYNLCCSVVFDFFTCLHLFHWRPFPIALQGVVDVSPRPRPRSRLHLRSCHPSEIPGIILATSRFVHSSGLAECGGPMGWHLGPVYFDDPCANLLPPDPSLEHPSSKWRTNYWDL